MDSSRAANHWMKTKKSESDFDLTKELKKMDIENEGNCDTNWIWNGPQNPGKMAGRMEN